REAIIAANNLSGPDTITLSAETYTLSVGGPGEEAAQTGDLDITDSLTIDGAGAGSSIITASGQFNDRIFDVVATPFKPTVMLSGLTVSGGSTFDEGGGIRNDGDLTLSDAVVEGNQISSPSGSAAGGGISNDAN